MTAVGKYNLKSIYFSEIMNKEKKEKEKYSLKVW